MAIQNNTDVAHEIDYVVQTLSVSGDDAAEAILVSDESVPANATSTEQDIDIPTLQDGYYQLLGTAQDEASAVSGSGRAYFHVSDGEGTLVSFQEWYFNSGAENLGGAG